MRAKLYVVLMSSGLLLMSTYIVRTLLPYIIVDIGGSSLDVSRILYISFLVLAFISPIAGWLCDILGSRKILLTTSTIIALLIPAYLYIHSIVGLLAIRLTHALLGSFALAASLTIASWITSRGGIGIGFLRLSQGMGIALGPMLAGLLSLVSCDLAFVIASILALTPLTALIVKELDVKKNTPPPWTSIKYAGELIKAGKVKILLPLAIAEALSFAILLSYYTPFLVINLKFTESEYGLFLFLEAMAFSLGSYISEKIYRSWSEKAPILCCALLLLSYLSLHVIRDKVLVLTAGTAIGLFSSLILNPVYIEVSNIVRDEIRGVGINLIDMFVNISFSLIAPLEIIVAYIGYENVMLIPTTILAVMLIISLYYDIKQYHSQTLQNNSMEIKPYRTKH